MKNHLKFIALFSVLMALALGFMAYLGRGASVVGDTVLKSSLSTEARILLIAMKGELEARKARQGYWPERLTLADTNGVTVQKYSAGVINPGYEIKLWWGDPAMQGRAVEICPDCRLRKDGYKLIALGNLDDDPDLDVWFITETMEKPEQMRAD